MLKVLFFARIREELGCASLDLPWEAGAADLEALLERLCRLGDGRWREVLEQQNLVRAVNQQVVEGNPLLADGDEVAFFPPMTGG